MSATARNGTTRAASLDFYATPAWATRALVLDVGCPLSVFDPCAGTGAILAAIDGDAMRRGLELDEGRAQAARFAGLDVTTRDALDDRPWGDFGAVIMNPPFNRAQEFVERALAESRGRRVAALLRLSWLAGLKRAAFHRRHPADVLVLPRRPSFTGGGTDATDYAWFCWGWGGPGGHWRVLELAAGGV